ncbi:MAG: putative enzyme related to lactoylglutathione lyase [Phycisphaerales bacterium]|jgi:predicted enzyme related to lactoylglutathione lyase
MPTPPPTPPSLGYDGGLTLAAQCTNLDNALAWYTDVLGFTVLYRLDDMGWAELATPVARVNMGLSQVEKPTVGAGPVPTWGVTDIDAARAELEGKGVRFDGDTQTIPDMVRLATFFDPDGNALMLYQQLGDM